MSAITNRQLAEVVLQNLEQGHAKDVVVQQLAAYLVQQRRTKDADAIMRIVLEQRTTRLGKVELQVTTAHELSDALAQEIKDIFVNEGSDISINHVKDSSVIGGVLVELPGKRLDLTVRRRLQRLKETGVK